MDAAVLESVRSSLKAAAGSQKPGVWAVYDSLIRDSGFSWKKLAAVSVISAELFQKNAGLGNHDQAAVFRTMNEMVFDYAAEHAEEIDNYRLFRENCSHWEDTIPAH